MSPWLELPLPAQGSSGATTCPRGSGSRSQLGAATCPSGSGSRSYLRAGPGPPCIPGLCGLPASKEISSGGPAIMISIREGAPVSSKVLRDKGYSACS
jgi:hypothetical protein